MKLARPGGARGALFRHLRAKGVIRPSVKPGLVSGEPSGTWPTAGNLSIALERVSAVQSSGGDYASAQRPQPPPHPPPPRPPSHAPPREKAALASGRDADAAGGRQSDGNRAAASGPIEARWNEPDGGRDLAERQWSQRPRWDDAGARRSDTNGVGVWTRSEVRWNDGNDGWGTWQRSTIAMMREER